MINGLVHFLAFIIMAFAVMTIDTMFRTICVDTGIEHRDDWHGLDVKKEITTLVVVILLFAILYIVSFYTTIVFIEQIARSTFALIGIFLYEYIKRLKNNGVGLDAELAGVITLLIIAICITLILLGLIKPKPVDFVLSFVILCANIVIQEVPIYFFVQL